MATSSRNSRSAYDSRLRRRVVGGDEDEPLGDLLRRFAQDAATLVRQEIALAKLELRETVRHYLFDAAKFGVAAALGWFGALALLAFAIVGLGDLINNYWLSSLIISVVLLVAAGVLARAALKDVRRRSLAPEETVATLKEDKQWVEQEMRELKQTFKS